uniref:Reelin domain-containing protein n=1 Tax=Amazona collaria TaxID=241587 RepID=A0A8B9FE54_9PSIT
MGLQAIVGWACTTLCLVSYVSAFSHGASLSACTDMMPRHLRAQLHSPNNYVTVHINMSFYSPGDKVPVTVRSTRDFMGFLLQARKVSNDEITGTFIFIPPGSKLLTCFEDGDTVTHSDKSLKRNLSFVWKAPDQPIGDIKFFISVVQSYFVYWAKIESAVVAHRGQNKMPAGSSKRPNPVTAVTPLQGPADPTGTANTKSGNILEASHHVTASPSAPHLHTYLGDAAVTTAWFDNADAASNLSSASRQMAERKLAPQPEKAGTRSKEEEEEVGGNTLPWVTRPAPEFTVPGKGEDPGRGTRLLAAQLGILLVCTATLGLALAAAVRCVCAQHCHKQTEVSFSEPDPSVITVRENGEVMHFRKVRENSFVLVQAEYNWVSPSSSGKKTII